MFSGQPKSLLHHSSVRLRIDSRGERDLRESLLWSSAKKRKMSEGNHTLSDDVYPQDINIWTERSISRVSVVSGGAVVFIDDAVSGCLGPQGLVVYDGYIMYQHLLIFQIALHISNIFVFFICFQDT